MTDKNQVCECVNPKLSEKWGWELCKRCNNYTGKKFKQKEFTVCRDCNSSTGMRCPRHLKIVAKFIEGRSCPNL